MRGRNTWPTKIGAAFGKDLGITRIANQVDQLSQKLNNTTVGNDFANRIGGNEGVNRIDGGGGADSFRYDSASDGKEYRVTDSTLAMTSANYGSTPSGGGGNKVRLFSNGTAWLLA